MKRCRPAPLTMLFVMSSSAILFVILSSPLRAAPPAGSATATAQQAVQSFYTAYLAYLESVAGKSRSPRTAQREADKVERPYFTPRLLAYQAKLAKYCGATHADVPEECDGDPLICAQEPPTWSRVSGGDATSVSVELCFNCEATIPYERHTMQIATATVKHTGGRWRIDGIGCSNPDLRALNGDDIKALATRAAAALKECAGLARGATLRLTDVSNRTDEHVDKAALTSALHDRLAGDLGVTLAAAAEGTGGNAPALSTALGAEKSDSKSGYLGVYRLELKLTNPDCAKTASLEKRKGAVPSQ